MQSAGRTAKILELAKRKFEVNSTLLDVTNTRNVKQTESDYENQPSTSGSQISGQTPNTEISKQLSSSSHHPEPIPFEVSDPKIVLPLESDLENEGQTNLAESISSEYLGGSKGISQMHVQYDVSYESERPTVLRILKKPNYFVSPVHSGESDVDDPDEDPNFDNTKTTFNLNPVSGSESSTSNSNSSEGEEQNEYPDGKEEEKKKKRKEKKKEL
ncbi:uncharacterized protein LOC115875630 [Sitophilus oryzae]|uniref:Uncharacterized protein LOC115875630 n=1 Tax=Sitophilus oryzae TaxID=7048 RepID=A0A6J2X738_SITOR|nr:uncharacterized protein LOC115875630 [Sitophilus oryzae]